MTAEELIYEDDYFRVTQIDGATLRMTRSNVSWQQGRGGNVIGALDALVAIVESRSSSGAQGLLLDLRDVRPTNDPEFEQGTAKHRRMVSSRFQRVAVLVKTEIGKLQVQRLMREEGTNPEVFDDEAEALRYLTGPG